MSDVISLRVNNLCLLPANPSEVMGDCAKMLVEGYKKNTITIRQMGYSPFIYSRYGYGIIQCILHNAFR